MNSSEINTLLLYISIFVGVMMMLINIIINRKRTKYIKSIKPGDMFCHNSDVNSYYRKIEEYKYELTNPFESSPIQLVFPDSTCMIKELRKSKIGEIWVSYVRIDTPEKISVAENLGVLTEHYQTLNDFLEFRKRVKRFEM